MHDPAVITRVAGEDILHLYAFVLAKIDDFKDILDNPERVYDIIKTELNAIKQKFGDERRTKIESISGEVDVGTHDVLSIYDPGDLRKTAKGFDRILEQYLGEYEKAGLRPARYADVDSFISFYLK